MSIMQRKVISAALFKDLKLWDSLLIQKSRCIWLTEGDTNTRYLHNLINKKRKHNEIMGVEIEGSWLEEVDEVKIGISNHFREQFQSVGPSLAPDFASKRVS